VIFEMGTRQIPRATIEFGGEGPGSALRLVGPSPRRSGFGRAGGTTPLCDDLSDHPSGKSLLRFCFEIGRQATTERPKSIARKQQFCEPVQTDRAIKIFSPKYLTFHFSEIMFVCRHPASMKRGVSADRHERGGGERWT
jgi:hypothetical protein